MAQATKTTGAESIRWDLTDLFASPTDPAIEASMATTLESAKSFEAKYKGKQAVETFFWRTGDMISALLVFEVFKLLPIGRVSAVNAAVVAVWVLLAVGIAREHKKLSTQPVAEAA